MIELLLAVMTASLFGSLHCVGMCGPFVLIATSSVSSATSLESPRAQGIWGAFGLPKVLPLVCYHLGRLTTYLILGTLIGSIASASQGLAGRWGIGQAASLIVGTVLLAIGMLRLWSLFRASDQGVKHSKSMALWHAMIARIRVRIKTKRPTLNAYVWGFLSTWLPCGWLYLFAIASGAAGSILASMAMMGAFWLGTLPSLSAVAWGGRWLRRIDPKAMQWMAALLLIGFGLWTLSSRASIDLSGIDLSGIDLSRFDAQGRPSISTQGTGPKPSLDAAAIESLEAIELPCCSAD